MANALPANAGGHVLALGEAHTSAKPLESLAQQAGMLAQEHNLGTLGLERDAFYNVFLWAYRDGKLPVPAEQAREYLKAIFSQADIFQRTEQIVTLVDQANNHGMDMAMFDVRGDWRGHEKYFKPVTDALERVFTEYPQALEAIRTSPELLRDLPFALSQKDPELARWFAEKPGREADKSFITRFGFLVYEAQALLKKAPHYQQRLDSIEDMIALGRKEGVGFDALSAALLAQLAQPGKNILSISGLNHISGAARERIEGTFDEHLHSMGLQTTSALIGSMSDIQDRVQKKFDSYAPIVQDLPLDKALQAAAYGPELLAKMGEKPHQHALILPGEGQLVAETPGTKIHDPAYIDKSLKQLQSPALAAALARIRKDTDAAQTTRS